MRRDAAGPFAEILPPEAFDLTAQSLPVLDSHNTASVRAILGQTLSIRREGDSIVADMRLSSAEDVAPIGQRTADGTLSGVSIGYRVAGWATRREAGQRIKSATRVQLTEVTLTSNPADPNAVVRAQEGGMPKDIQDTDRAALIARVRAAHDLPEEWATRMAEAEDELTDDEIRAAGRETALATRAARPQVQIRTAAQSAEDPAVVRERQARRSWRSSLAQSARLSSARAAAAKSSKDAGRGQSGHGLAKIIRKHPEVLDDLQGRLASSADVLSDTANRVRVTSGRDIFVISRDVQGARKTLAADRI